MKKAKRIILILLLVVTVGIVAFEDWTFGEKEIVNMVYNSTVEALNVTNSW